MHLSKIEFFSLLSYSTHGTSDAEQDSKTWRNAVKNDQFVQINSDSKLTSDSSLTVYKMISSPDQDGTFVSYDIASYTSVDTTVIITNIS